MMHDCMNQDKDVEQKSKIPPYVRTLFDHFCHHLDTIYINKLEFEHYIPALQKYLGTTAAAMKSPGSKTKKSKFGKFGSKSKTEENVLEPGVFAQYLKIKVQNVSHFEWIIEGKDVDTFWKGKWIKGKPIECTMSHLMDRDVRKHKFVFTPQCRQHTINTKDGRFCYGLELNKYPQGVKAFTFRFEVCIPEIEFYDAETMRSQGTGAFGDNRFDSFQLNKFQAFSMHVIISMRSVSLS
eukprot:562168_1